ADDRERLLLAALPDQQLADPEDRDERRVVRQGAELALDAGQLDAVDLVAVGQALGRDDLELERHQLASLTRSASRRWPGRRPACGPGRTAARAGRRPCPRGCP